MADLNSREALELLRRSKKIWAPNGWTFDYKVVDNPDAKTAEEIFSPGFLWHELRGPNEETHLWIFDGQFQLIADPSYEDLPRSWPIVARIALLAYTEFCEESPNF
jgi:hypothetical protein